MISVSSRQKGNELLKHLKSVSWKYADIVADYYVPPTRSGARVSTSSTTSTGSAARNGAVLAAGTASNILYLSLKYYRIHPEYILGRMTKLGTPDKNNSDDADAAAAYYHFARILLVVVDIENPADTLKDVTRLSFVRDFTMVVAWSNAEAAYYISQLKLMQGSSLDPSAKTYNSLTGLATVNTVAAAAARHQSSGSSRQTPDGDSQETMSTTVFHEHFIDTVTKVRSVNKTDAQSLLTQYGSLANAIMDGGRSVESISGWGTTKAKRFQDAISRPFINTILEEEDLDEEEDEDI